MEEGEGMTRLEVVQLNAKTLVASRASATAKCGRVTAEPTDDGTMIQVKGPSGTFYIYPKDAASLRDALTYLLEDVR